MNDVFDFLKSAMPWIAIGLFVACSCVSVKAKAEGRETGSFFQALSWSPSMCFFFVALMEMYSGNQSNGTTWLILGAANAVINFANIHPDSKK